MRKKIGKIQSVSFGYGGYQDVMIGISFELGSQGWGVGDFWGEWATDRTEHTQWTEQDRINGLGKTVMRIKDLLSKAKVNDIKDLKNIPVEVTFDGNSLYEWRVLEEVI